MLKRSKVFLLIVFLCNLLLIPDNSFAFKLKVGKVLRKIDDTPEYTIKRSLKRNSTFSRKLDDISKKLKPGKILTAKEKLKIYAKDLVSRNKNALDVLNNSRNVLDVFYLHSKYGDEFINTAKSLSDVAGKIKIKEAIESIPPKSLEKLKKLGAKIDPNIAISKEEVIDRFTKAIKYTGRAGYKVGKELALLIKKYPKSTAVLLAYAWYLSDPVGFQEALRKAGGSLSDFISVIAKEVATTGTEVVLKTPKAVAEGITKTFKENFSWSGLIVIIITILGGILFFLLKRGILFEFFKRFNKQELKENTEKIQKNNKPEQKVKYDRKQEEDDDEEEGLL